MDCSSSSSINSSSKRGRGNNTNETTAAKRAKVAVMIKAEVVVVGESGESRLMAAAEEAAAAEVEELRLSWRSGMDEEMPWATLWFPFWEAEKDAYDVLYGDVVWDLDIWGFKAGHNL